MTDRNLLEDFWTLASFIEDNAPDNYAKFDLPTDFDVMRSYWGRPEEREPWGVCVLIHQTLSVFTEDGRQRREVLVVHGPKGIGLPGGKPNKGESPLVAGCRELHEETGFCASSERLTLASDLPIRADNGMPTFLLVEKRYPDVFAMCATIKDGFESAEGVTYWAHPKVLVGKHARFPEYNRKVLTMAGLL